MQKSDRKSEHIEICLEKPVDFSRQKGAGFTTNGLEKVVFEYDALPEISLDEIDLSTTLLGKRLRLPLVIGAMTGGNKEAKLINERLAKAAQECGVGFALGSQRRLIENKDEDVVSSFLVRKLVSDIPLLIGNIGAVSLNYGVGLEKIKEIISLSEVDAFCFHLNPLQECVQPEGQTNFSGLYSKLHEVSSQLKCPVVVKEVGSGISSKTARKLSTLPIAAVEVAGVGGTSWPKVESFRTNDMARKSIGDLFGQWGVNTAQGIENCRKELPEKMQIVGSGGIRTGLDIAKALILGADACAIASPFLRAAVTSEGAVIEEVKRLELELKSSLFSAGARNISEFRKVNYVIR
ncbi:MAG: type 2 isopentenyl-diphosphate Delta-isomerase [Bacteriovoracia bacterium]